MQIAQLTIPAHCRGLVNGQWKSLISIFELTIYFISLNIRETESFSILIYTSTFMVISATILFHLTLPKVDQ